jgi:hypothetical protein
MIRENPQAFPPQLEAILTEQKTDQSLIPKAIWELKVVSLGE